MRFSGSIAPALRDPPLPWIPAALRTDQAQNQLQDLLSVPSMLYEVSSLFNWREYIGKGQGTIMIECGIAGMYPTAPDKSRQGGMTLSQPLSRSRKEIQKQHLTSSHSIPKVINTSLILYFFTSLLHIVLYRFIQSENSPRSALEYPIKPRFLYISSTRQNVHLVRATREASPPVRLSSSNH